MSVLESDLIGVGAGPANLSLAALLACARERGLTSIRSTFLERNPAVFWHSGQMFPGTLMQTEFYRDLVTPIDPTSRFTFLNYLKSNGRIDQFFCSSTIYPPRREFEDYFNWVARQLPDVIFSTDVGLVDFDPDRRLFFIDAEVETKERKRYEARNIVLGCGPSPNVDVSKSQSRRVVDVSNLLHFAFSSPLRRVLVVGGGQSAAECLNFLLDREPAAALQIKWVTSETAFRALDIGNFSRESYSASFPRAFARLPEPLRRKTIDDEKNVSNGITPSIAQALYQRLYRLRHLKNSDPTGASVLMHPNTEVLEIRDEMDGAAVTARALATGETTVEVYDLVILCTGFDERSVFEGPLIGDELRRRINMDEDPCGYAIAWDGPDDRMIFVQSQNKKSHGVGDANFISAPGRNASILNVVAGKEVYGIDEDDKLVSL